MTDGSNPTMPKSILFCSARIFKVSKWTHLLTLDIQFFLSNKNIKKLEFLDEPWFESHHGQNHFLLHSNQRWQMHSLPALDIMDNQVIFTTFYPSIWWNLKLRIFISQKSK